MVDEGCISLILASRSGLDVPLRCVQNLRPVRRLPVAVCRRGLPRAQKLRPVRCLSVAVCRRGLHHPRLPPFTRSAPAPGDTIEAYVTLKIFLPPRAVSTSSVSVCQFPLRVQLTILRLAAHNCKELSVLWEELLSAMVATAAGLRRRRCSAPERLRRSEEAAVGCRGWRSGASARLRRSTGGVPAGRGVRGLRGASGLQPAGRGVRELRGASGLW